MRVLLILTVVAVTAVTAGQAGAVDEKLSRDLRHSTNVVTFFQNHRWLRAPNQPNCQVVPWTKSCKIARRIYQREHRNVARIKQAIWYDYHYNWRSWLPDNWRRVGTCETGYGGDPNFSFANGSFVSAFGISRSIYDSDAAYMGAPPWNDAHPPTPRQQYLAALGHYAQYGDGWGCPGP